MYNNRFYICKSDVIPTNNSFMHADVTSPNTLTSSLISCVMAESKSRFATLSEEDLNLLLDDQDAKSTKRATKSALKVFHQYLKEKKADEPQTKDTLANVLKLCRSSKSGWHFLFKEHIEQPQIWIKSAFQSYSWFWHHQRFRVHRRKQSVWRDVCGPEATRAGKSWTQATDMRRRP